MNKLMITFVIVIIDQFSKLMIKYNLISASPKDILGDFLRFTYVENPGLAFGVSVGSFGWLLFIVTVLITLYIIYYLFSDMTLVRAEILSLNFILGGAIGNLIDRTFTLFNLFDYRGVIDFIDIGLSNFYRWPYIFNIADMSVTVGIIIFIFSSYLYSNQNNINNETA
jgi:signal peptidase II